MNFRRRLMGNVSERRNEGWEHIEKALEWRGGSRDVELARKRYIDLTWWVFGDGAITTKRPALAPALENVAKIATDDNNRARAHFVLAQMIAQRGNAYEIDRVNAEYEAALAIGKASKSYGDTLINTRVADAIGAREMGRRRQSQRAAESKRKRSRSYGSSPPNSTNAIRRTCAGLK